MSTGRLRNGDLELGVEKLGDGSGGGDRGEDARFSSSAG